MIHFALASVSGSFIFRFRRNCQSFGCKDPQIKRNANYPKLIAFNCNIPSAFVMGILGDQCNACNLCIYKAETNIGNWDKTY